MKAELTEPKLPQEPLWDEKTHKAIVEKAVELMGNYAESGSNKHVKDFNEIFGDNQHFMSCLYKGLKDADDKSPWNDEYWAYHFYNPKTKKNYKGQTHTTARSEARRYFKLSEHYAQRIRHFNENNIPPGDQLYKNAGYYLGLSLHFLTDLTQPMHAANFTNIFGEEHNVRPRADLRHGGFEVYTDNEVERGLFDKLEPLKDEQLALFPNNNVGRFIHAVAEQSKNVFDQYFLPVLRKKLLKEFGGIDLIYEGYWRKAEADPLIALSTVKAPYIVANYITNFMVLTKARPTLSSEKWYEILEPTKAPVNHADLDKFLVSDLSDGFGQWVYRNESHGGDQQRFYLLFNSDGTVSIGCKKDNMNKLWRAETAYHPAWIGQSEDLSRNNRFRIASFEDGKVMIFESSKNEVVHVNTGEADGNWHGWYTRFATAYDKNMWFILREVGDISSEDQNKIKNHYSHYKNYNWAGEKSSVPDWEKNIPLKIGDESFEEIGHLSEPKGTLKREDS